MRVTTRWPAAGPIVRPVPAIVTGDLSLEIHAGRWEDDDDAPTSRDSLAFDSAAHGRETPGGTGSVAQSAGRSLGRKAERPSDDAEEHGRHVKRAKKRVRWADEHATDIAGSVNSLEEVQFVEDEHRGFEIGAVTAQRQQQARRSAEHSSRTKKSSFLRKRSEERLQERAACQRLQEPKDGDEEDSLPASMSFAASTVNGPNMVPRVMMQRVQDGHHCQ